MSIIQNLYNRLALVSPHIEVRLRQLYWKHHSGLQQYNPNKNSIKAEDPAEKVDFDDILSQLKGWGVGEGSLLIVHSSYDNLRCTGLTPMEIIDKLLSLVGEKGTLAMPAIRIYKENPTPDKWLSTDLTAIECRYNLKRTPVHTGMLPSLMIRYPQAEISKHPISTLCAIGPLAKEMMAHNIEGDCPSAHGVNSSWKFCLDHNALICSIGTDLRHHNTMGHVAEEAFGDWYWSDEEWFNIRKFTIEAPREEPLKIKVKERKPQWGMLHQAELNRYHDLLKNGVLKTKKIGSVLVEFEESQKLIDYLQSRNKKGYPYFK